MAATLSMPRLRFNFLLKLAVFVCVMYIFSSLLHKFDNPALPPHLRFNRTRKKTAKKPDMVHRDYDEYQDYDSEADRASQFSWQAVNSPNTGSVSASKLGLGHYIQPTVKAAFDFVLVTGASGQWFEQVSSTVASIQHQYPDKHLVIYNWGLDNEQQDEVQGWCNVKLVNIHVSRLASVNSMQFVSSKPWMLRYRSVAVWIIIHALHHYHSVLWLDPSVTFTGRLAKGHLASAVENSGLLYLKPQTQGDTYGLYVGIQGGIRLPAHNEAGALFVMRTEHVSKSVLWWWYLCTVTKGCVVPSFTTMCDTGEASPGPPTYQNCSSLEHSLLSILGGNLHNFYVKSYGWKYRRIVKELSVNPQQADFKIKHAPCV